MHTKVHISIYCFILSSVLSIISIHAQTLPAIRTEVITMENGLSHNTVHRIVDDEKGFLWIATAYGLNRYDGYEFKVFTMEDGLLSDKVNTVIKAGGRKLWVEFDGKKTGIFDTYTFKTTPVDSLLKEQRIPLGTRDTYSVFQNTGDSVVWIKSHKGLFSYDGINFKHLIKGNYDEFWNPFLWMASGKQDHFWVFNARDTIMTHFDAKSDTVASYPIKKNINLDHFFFQIRPDKQGLSYFYQHNKYDHFIIQKEDTLIESITPSTASFNRKTITYSGTQDFFVTLMGMPNLHWALLDNTGKNIAKYPYNEWVRNFFADQQGIIWAVSTGRGMRKISFHRPKFKTFLTRKNLTVSRFGAREIIEDTEHNIIIGGSGKVHLLSPSTGQINLLFDNPPKKYKESFSYVFGLCMDKDRKTIWLAPGGGIMSYNAKTGVIKNYPYKDTNDFGPQQEPTLFQSRSGRIWIGHRAGIAYVDTMSQNSKQYRQDNGFSEIHKSRIHCLYENDQGIWVASDKGIFLLREGEGIIAHYNKGNSIPYSNIAHIYEENGSFWLASKGGGLIHWNPQTNDYKQYTTKEGLSHNIVYAVYPDNYDNLWMSSDRGIMRFNKESELFNTYLPKNGVGCEEFNTLSHYKAKDGTIYFGGIDGVTSFHPRDFRKKANDFTPNLQITHYAKRNEDDGKYEDYTAHLLANNNIIIHPDERSFELKFALLDFQNPAENRYAYKVEGIHKDWIYQKENLIRTGGFPYGNYKLKIKAHSSDGYWTKYPLSIDLCVLRPFYLQTWFIITFILSLGLAIGGFIHLRIRQLKQSKRKLERIVSERTAQIEKDKALIEQQAEDLKELDKLKSRFFANISHELRTPLTLILGPLSYIMNEPFSDDIRSILVTMQRNGRNLLRLVEEILDLSKLDANRLQLNEESINFYSFIKRSFSAFGSQATYQKIDYRLEYGIDKELHLNIDAGKVEKIINNLLSNAIKFTPSGGQVTLYATNTLDSIQLLVEDSGLGISGEDLPRIFERFFQSGLTNRPAQGGTGVGLALVKELVDFMKGKVEVSSELSKGTTFIVTLPMKIADKPFEEQTEVIPPTSIETHTVQNTSKEKVATILLAEDHSDMRTFICQLLSKEYEVLTAENGAVALDILQQQEKPVDLIISDVMMPVMDGFELLKHVKDSDTWRHIPMVMLTARAAQRDKLSALSAGVDDYILKPFSATELKTRIRNLILNYKARSSWILTQHQSSAKTTETGEDITQEIQMSKAEKVWLHGLERLVQSELDNEDLNINLLAEKLQLSRSSVERKIKKLTGLSPLKYIREIRLQAARELIESGTVDRVADACYQTGFKNPHYFSQLFSERFGKSPKRYAMS